MRMSKGITQESMLSVLPGVLARDKGMYDLAQLIGWITARSGSKVDSPSIFQNIDDLPEDLLDILARDCKIDWYDYNADVEIKRQQLKSNWHVRKGIGTVSAVKTALQDIWQDTTVEEWYEYGGEPGYFQVLLGTDREGQINFSKAARMLDVFKPVRAHLEGYIILRIRCGIVVHTNSKFNTKYHVPVSGTVPRYYTHGNKSHEDIVAKTESGSQKYHVPTAGNIIVGTYPNYSTHGNKSREDVVVQSRSDDLEYHVPAAGTVPRYYTHGSKSYEDIVANTASGSQDYHVPVSGSNVTGTYPNYATHGSKSHEDVSVQSKAGGTEYHVPVTGEVTVGTYPNYSTHGGSDSSGLGVTAESVSVGYGVRKCGTSNNELF